jgi:uncharacterized membrane protein
MIYDTETENSDYETDSIEEIEDKYFYITVYKVEGGSSSHYGRLKTHFIASQNGLDHDDVKKLMKKISIGELLLTCFQKSSKLGSI